MGENYERLVAAVRKGSVCGIKTVLHSGGGVVDINKHFESDGPDNHVLYTAVIFGRSNVVALLLAFGALVDNKHEMWDSAMFNQYSPDIFLQLFHALTTQLAAAHNNRLQGRRLTTAVWYYLEKGRQIQFRVNRSLLEEVVCSSTTPILSLMLSLGMEVNPANKPAGFAINTLLRDWEREMKYTRYERGTNTENVRILIEAGAIVCSYPNDGPSVLQLAIDLDKTRDAELVRLILDTDEVHGINVASAYGKKGRVRTPLVHVLTVLCDCVTEDNRANMTTQLIESGAVYIQMAQMCASTDVGTSILSLALKRELCFYEDARSDSMLDVLLARMTPSEVRMPATTDHGSLVMQAVTKGPRHYDRPTSVVLAKLLAHGADASAVDGPSGQTPLYYLVAKSLGYSRYEPSRAEENEKVVVQLLQGGADIFRENADGQNVVDLVAANASNWKMHKDTYQLLYDIAMRRQNNLEAFGMALHPQVGAGSKVSVLPHEMMQEIMSRLYVRVLPSVQDVFP
jgi:hypothetical protein